MQQPPPDILLVHTGRCISQPVRFASTGVMKHLGVHWDMRFDGATIYQLTLDSLEAAISRPRTFPCSPKIKQAVLEHYIYPSLIYQMKFANWPLAKYRDFDKKVNALIKKVTKFQNSFPTALIYMGKGIYMGLELLTSLRRCTYRQTLTPSPLPGPLGLHFTHCCCNVRSNREGS